MLTDWHIPAHALLFYSATIIALWVAHRAYHKRTAPGAMWLFWMMLSVALWSLTFGLEASASQTHIKIFFSKVSYIGIQSGPVLAFFFVIQFAHTGYVLKMWIRYLLWGISTFNILVAFTNDWHSWQWSGFNYIPSSVGPILVYERGPWYVFSIGYLYVLMLVTTYILISKAYRLRAVYRQQVLLLLLAALTPWSASMIYFLDLEMIRGIDLTPLAFTLTGTALGLGIQRFQLLDLVPIAREKVIENLSEAILVLNSLDRIVDYNPAAVQFLAPNPAATIAWIGKPAEEALPDWKRIRSHFGANHGVQSELTLTIDNNHKDYRLTVTPLIDTQGNLTGRIATIVDITMHKQSEAAAVQARKLAEALYGASMALGSSLEFDRILHAILEQIQRVINFDCAAVLLINGDNLTLAAVTQSGGQDLQPGMSIPLSEPGAETQAANSAQPVRINRLADAFPVEKPSLVRRANSFLGLPILFHERMTGLLALYSYNPDQFSAADEQVGLSFASGVAIALENSRLYEKMKEYAITDPLTGAHNRRHFFERLDEEIKQAQRSDHPLGLILLDIDHFKGLNDRFGHIFGDRVLQLTARKIREMLRGSDILARYGGEEFVVLLPDTNREGAQRVAERIRTQIAALPLEEIDGHQPAASGLRAQITVSIGVSLLGAGAATADELLQRADEALYAAKAGGRNQVYVGAEGLE